MRNIARIGKTPILYTFHPVPALPVISLAIKGSEKMKEVVAVVGLGYVGLPLAVEFGKKFETPKFVFPFERATGQSKTASGNRANDGAVTQIAPKEA